MDRALEFILKGPKSGGSTSDTINMLLGVLSPQMLPMIERQASFVLGAVENGPCANSLAKFVEGVVSLKPKMWGLRMIDASAKAPESVFTGNTALLGDYDECLGTEGPGFTGRYCLATACLSKDDVPCLVDPLEPGRKALAVFMEEQAKETFNFTRMMEAADRLPVRVGVCVPSTCAADDLLSMANVVLPVVAPEHLRLEIDPADCTARDENAFVFNDYMVMFFMLGLILLVAAATAYDYATRAPAAGQRRTRSGIALAFSAARNGTRLLDVRKWEDALPAVEGVRALSLLWVTTCHSIFSVGHLPVANAESAIKIMDNPLEVLLRSSFMAVDTFLVLSGLLVSYMFLRRSSSGRRMSLFSYYGHRLLRLSPALGIVLLLQSTVFLKLRDGPMWRLQPSYQCPDSWWYIMLHICNYFRPGTVRCAVHLWYLSLDWQLYALAPLALIALRRRPRQALQVMAALVATGIAMRFWVAYSEGLRTPWGSEYSPIAMQKMYFPTHMRFVPYVMGLALGYILHRTRQLKQPLNLSQGTVGVLQMLWPLLLAACIAWVRQFTTWGREPPGQLHQALHMALVEPLWGLAVAIFLFLAATGRGGFLSNFLSHGWWQPLCRLSYGMYLLHISLLDSVAHDTRTPIHFSLWHQLLTGLTAFVVSAAPATVLWLVAEAPVCALEDVLCSPGKGERKRTMANGHTAAEKLALSCDYVQIPCGTEQNAKELGC